MIRFLLYLALILIIYFILKRLFLVPKKKRNLPLHDELVEDPVCGVYTPKKHALSLRAKGKRFYFCSEKCKKIFEENLRKA
jgi:YHS domain-containing protein